MVAFQVTEVVTAVRCPRQFVLAGEGHRVEPPGGSSIGTAAHAVLATLARDAVGDRRLLAALAERAARAEPVRDACYRIAYREAHHRAIQLAGSIPGAELARLDTVTRSLSALIGTLLVRARTEAADAREAVARSILATEDAVTIDLGDMRVNGRVDLLCRDARTGLTWVWDLKTYAGSDRAQAEQVRLYAMAYRARGIDAAAALLHVTEDRVELVRGGPARPQDTTELRAQLQHMAEWRQGATPPAADEPSTCRACVAQSVCWARWGRTLPEDEANGGESEASTPAASQPPASEPAQPPPATPRQELEPAALWVGQDVASGTPARIEPSDLVHHMAVFGSTGAGKTWLAKCLVEEAALAGIPVLAVDMQGDLAQLASLRPDEAGHPSERATAFRERVETRIFTPASDAGLRICLNPLRVPSPSLDEEARGFCMAAIAENLLGAVRIPDSWGLVAKEYIAQLLTAAPPGVSLSGLVELVREPGSLHIDPLLRSKTRRETLAEQLRVLAAGTQRFLYDKGRRLRVEDLLTASEPGKTPINVLWLNSLGDTGARQRFVATVLSDVYAWMLGQPSSAPQLLLYLDEVGPFVPPHGDPPAKSILRRLFKEGRKYGVCGLFCTQNFTDVDYKVLSQAHTLALGRIGATQDKARARKLLSWASEFDATSAADQLMSAAHGTFLLTRSAQSGTPRWIKVRSLLTAHGVPWTDEDVMANTPPSLREAWRKG